jgi:hypothetical protein
MTCIRNVLRCATQRFCCGEVTALGKWFAVSSDFRRR